MNKTFKKSIFVLFIFVLLIIVFFTYRPFLIRLTVNEYFKRNNVKGYSIVYIEKFPAVDGYAIHLKNDTGKERTLTVITEALPITVIHDNMIDKENMK